MRLLALLVLFSVGAAGQPRPGGESGENIFTQGMMLFVLEDYAGALKQFETLVKIDEKSGAGFYMKSRAESALDQYAQAELSAETAVQLDRSSLYYLQHYATVLEKNHKGKAARDAWSELIRMKPEDANAYYHLLELQAGEGDSDGALKTLELAEKQFGPSEKITRARQQILLRENKVEAALKEGSKITNPEFVLNQAVILVQNGQRKEAIKLLREAVTAHPDLGDAYGLLSELYATERDGQTSRQLVEQVIQNTVFPYSLKVNVLGNHLNAFGADTETLTYVLEKAEALMAAYPGQARAFLYAGDISFRLRKRLDARGYYSKAVALDKNQFEVWLALLQIHYALGDFRQLEKDADAASIYFPNQPAIWFYLGWAQWRNQREDDAEIAFEEVLHLGGDGVMKAGAAAGLAHGDLSKLEVLAGEHPENPYVQYVLAALSTNKEKALALAAGLSAKHPENNPYKLLLARALLSVGKGEEAMKTLDFIPREEADRSTEYFDTRGDAFAALGRSDEAREAWTKALLLDKTNTLIQKKIKQI